MVASSSFVVVLLLLLLVVATVTAFDNFYEENALYPGQRLRVNDALRWGQNKFIMQTDCNLCFYPSSWCSRSNGHGKDCATFLHDNGNLVVYNDNGNRVWHSNTAGTPGDYLLLLQDDTNVVLYGNSIWSTRNELRPPAIATTLAAAQQQQQQRQRVGVGAVRAVGAQPAPNRYVQNVLYEGERLLTKQELKTKSYRLIMQEDCNLVLYDAYTAIWSTKTKDWYGNCYAQLGNDGNLVVYSRKGSPLWSSESDGDGGGANGAGDYILIIRNDGVLMIYSKALWSAVTFKPRGGLTTNSTSTKISMVTSKE